MSVEVVNPLKTSLVVVQFMNAGHNLRGTLIFRLHSIYSIARLEYFNDKKINHRITFVPRSREGSYIHELLPCPLTRNPASPAKHRVADERRLQRSYSNGQLQNRFSTLVAETELTVQSRTHIPNLSFAVSSKITQSRAAFVHTARDSLANFHDWMNDLCVTSRDK